MDELSIGNQRVLSHSDQQQYYHISQPIFCPKTKLFTSLSIASISGEWDDIVNLLVTFRLPGKSLKQCKSKTTLGRQMEVFLGKGKQTSQDK